ESPVVRSTREPPRSDGEWRSRIAEEWRRGMFTDDRARALLGGDIMERVDFESRGIARARLEPNTLPLDSVWNPSALNALSSCPFVFLARYRLNLRVAETPEFEVPALEIGIF